jgi:hypothetical protein
MIGAVNQHAGDTGRSHLANRYFFGSLHRGWPLDEPDETEAARRASNLEGAPGRPKLPGGRQSISAGTTIQLMVSALLSRSREWRSHPDAESIGSRSRLIVNSILSDCRSRQLSTSVWYRSFG